jgi:diadenosine tetraphosphate (Ap4A) HIT family hydrolase
MTPPCPFCTPDPTRVCFQGKSVVALWDAYPLTDGHALIVPHPVPSARAPLRQNTGRQAAVVRVVREAHAEYDTHLGKAERGRDWNGLLSRVEQTVRIMPLWKLQTVGSERLDLLEPFEG